MKKQPIHILIILPVLFAFVGAFGQSDSRFMLPGYKKTVLKNGLTVFLMEQHEVPLIAFNAVFPAGSINDGEAYGLAYLTAEALLFGTKKYTKKEIEEELDFIGADYGTGAAKEFAEVAVSFVNTDLETVLPIMQEIITRPVFDEEEFEKRKVRLIMELDMVKERPSQIVGSYFNKFLFDSHPYGNPRTGQKATVAKITAEKVRAYYKSHFIPSRSAIAVVGDFDTADMKQRIEKLFGKWKTGSESASPPSLSELPALDGSRLLLVNKNDATETRFLIGGLGVGRSTPDYVPITIVNTVLGDRFTSWLNDALRVEAGLTYGAGSHFNYHKESGTFVISSYTATPNTVQAIDLALTVLERLHTEGIDEATLASAKNYVKGQYPPQFETTGELASLLTAMFVYDYDESFINTFQKKVDEMSVEKASEIISRYFPKDNFQFTLIGKASEIRDQVAKYGKIVEKEIKTDGY